MRLHSTPEVSLSLYRGLTSVRPHRRLVGSFADVREMFSSHQYAICTRETCSTECQCKLSGELFAFHTLKPGKIRSAENVDTVSAACFDIDGSTPDQARAFIGRVRQEGLSAVVSSTHSHRPEAPKLRAFLMLNRAVSAAEWPALWHVLNERFEIRADPKTRDPSRMFFMPSCPSDARPFVWSQVGASIDVNEALRNVPVRPIVRAPLSGGEWVELLNALKQGNRDNGLTKLAGVLFRELPPRLAEALLHSVNSSHCRPPLDSTQVNKM
jgi:hypothetical protein